LLSGQNKSKIAPNGRSSLRRPKLSQSCSEEEEEEEEDDDDDDDDKTRPLYWHVEMLKVIAVWNQL
jgi:hypothetical protein